MDPFLDINTNDYEATDTVMDEVTDRDEFDEQDEELLLNHYFRAGHAEGDEYTGLTTFHGMIRVFRSQNWPSLIFWSLVVTTCLVFYMIVSGSLLRTYSMQTTFMRKNSTQRNKYAKFIELCTADYDTNLTCDDIQSRSNYRCSISNSSNCLELEFHTEILLKTYETDLYMKIGTEAQEFHMISNSHSIHRFRLKLNQIERLDLKRAPCFSDWSKIGSQQSRNDAYTLKSCNELELEESEQCQPSCVEQFYKINYSKAWSKSTASVISIRVDPIMIIQTEVRKSTLVDILCYIGGTSSLFMGCSCVTLMELFIFLFKLISNSVFSKDPPELEDNIINEKYAFEYSDVRNKRRYAIFDKDTLEEMRHMHSNMDVRSIRLDRRASTFSFKKAPKLQMIRENVNFRQLDFMDTDSTSKHPTRQNTDDVSIDLQSERLDTVPEPAPRIIRPPLRRGSTTTSFASRTSRGSSSSTVRTYHISHPNREYRRIFSKNLPMNDF